jgi:hypothetical protein
MARPDHQATPTWAANGVALSRPVTLAGGIKVWDVPTLETTLFLTRTNNPLLKRYSNGRPWRHGDKVKFI